MILNEFILAGITEEVVKPILEEGVMVGGYTPMCLEFAKLLYERIVDEVVPVSSLKAAELTKLFENIFRNVNVALVNELTVLCERMDINFWEVLDAAATKPFGFMRFYPGPGLGGHCITVDPFYLSWKAKQYNFYTEFIELAGKINENMPYFVVSRIADALNDQHKSVRGSKVLLLGVAYKKDISDIRESPALKLIKILRRKGAEVLYHDPNVPELPKQKLKSQPLTKKFLSEIDCAVIVADHTDVNYDLVAGYAPLVVDTRNRMAGHKGGKVVPI